MPAPPAEDIRRIPNNPGASGAGPGGMVLAQGKNGLFRRGLLAKGCKEDSVRAQCVARSSWQPGRGLSLRLITAALWLGSCPHRPQGFFLVDQRMKKRILLADDDEPVRTMVGRVLELEDYEVLVARSGTEAVNKALTIPPDLVLLDIGMPDKDGWEAFALINRVQPFVPVILITARLNQQRAAAAAGIEALMEKPLDLALLLKTIRDLLDQSDQERARRLGSLESRNSPGHCLSQVERGQSRSGKEFSSPKP